MSTIEEYKEKMFEEIYYRCKILKERIDKTFKGVKE